MMRLRAPTENEQKQKNYRQKEDTDHSHRGNVGLPGKWIDGNLLVDATRK